MKRFHVHVSVHDLEQSIRFYSALFGAEPAVKKPDYAKWMLEDPRINFAISNRRTKAGIDHLANDALRSHLKGAPESFISAEPLIIVETRWIGLAHAAQQPKLRPARLRN